MFQGAISSDTSRILLQYLHELRVVSKMILLLPYTSPTKLCVGFVRGHKIVPIFGIQFTDDVGAN